MVHVLLWHFAAVFVLDVNRKEKSFYSKTSRFKLSHYVHIVCPKVLERKNQHQLKEELEQILMTQLKLREELKQELEVLEMQHKQK